MMQSNDICDYCKAQGCWSCLVGKDYHMFSGIEVEPVVYCKDCKHALFSPKIKEGFCYCELTKAVPLTHFCGWGDKRDIAVSKVAQRRLENE